MKIIFAKLIRRVSEGELYKPSIVAWGRVPWEVTESGLIISYRYVLYINLWFIELEWRFNHTLR